MRRHTVVKVELMEIHAFQQVSKRFRFECRHVRIADFPEKTTRWFFFFFFFTKKGLWPH